MEGHFVESQIMPRKDGRNGIARIPRERDFVDDQPCSASDVHTSGGWVQTKCTPRGALIPRPNPLEGDWHEPLLLRAVTKQDAQECLSFLDKSEMSAPELPMRSC